MEKEEKHEKEIPDLLWKTIISDLFDEFVNFFMPELYEKIDFKKGVIPLDKELAKIVKKSKYLSKYGDKLVKVHLKDGQEQWILIHIEIQGYKDELFSERMFRMFYRIYDSYNRKIVAMSIFTDGFKEYKPNKFEYDYFSTKLNYEYFSYKILEQDEEELKKSENAFALAILAGLYTLKTEGNTANKVKQRYIFKKKLTELLKNKGYNKEKIINIFTFIDGVLFLPYELELRYEEEVKEIFGGEKEMVAIEMTNLYQAKMWQAENKGKKEKAFEMAKKMLKKNKEIEEIVEFTELTKEEIEEIKNNIK